MATSSNRLSNPSGAPSEVPSLVMHPRVGGVGTIQDPRNQSADKNTMVLNPPPRRGRRLWAQDGAVGLRHSIDLLWPESHALVLMPIFAGLWGRRGRGQGASGSGSRSAPICISGGRALPCHGKTPPPPALAPPLPLRKEHGMGRDPPPTPKRTKTSNVLDGCCYCFGQTLLVPKGP